MVDRHAPSATSQGNIRTNARLPEQVGIHRCGQDPQQGHGLEPTITAMPTDLLPPDNRGGDDAEQSIQNPK